jgi:GPH family glycoside/pentoside/hexuronide:cation symporter
MNESESNIENNIREKELAKKTHSTVNVVSYSFVEFIMNIFAITFGAYIFYFYEVEVGLSSWLTASGFIIYAVWNAINDPLVGYICDRPYFFTKKWGRRFPWIITTIFPSVFIYLLLYTPPAVDPVNGQFLIFWWLVFITCLFDTVVSFWAVNYQALFPSKFRNVDERRTASGYVMVLAYIGIALGSLVPPFLIEYGIQESFVLQAWVIVIIAFIASLLAIPGVKEDPETIQRYLDAYKQRKDTKQERNTLQMFRTAFTNKNFLMFVALFLGYSVLRACLLGSLQYGVRYILKLDAVYSSIIMAGYLISSLVSTPIWAKLSTKINDNRKIMIYGAILSCIFTFPMTFLADLISWTIVLILWGVGIAGIFVARNPVLADIIDESIVETKERSEGIYNGAYLFILRLSLVFQAIIFATVHSLTGFVEGADTQSEFAIFGIHLTLGLIPMIFLLVGTILFWKYFDLTPDRIENVQTRLKELNL